MKVFCRLLLIFMIGFAMGAYITPIIDSFAYCGSVYLTRRQ